MRRKRDRGRNKDDIYYGLRRSEGPCTEMGNMWGGPVLEENVSHSILVIC